MDESTIYLILAILGGFIGLAGWLTGRDKKTTADATWRGEVNGKLDFILGIRNDVDSIKKTVDEHGREIAVIKATMPVKTKKVSSE